MSNEEFVQSKCDSINQMVGSLKYINCPVCRNKGYIAVPDGDREVIHDCECMKKRAVMRRLEESGLRNSIERYTFKTFQTPTEWQKSALKACREYAADPHGWLILSGSPGTGKTHLCTAVCGELLKKGMDVRYLKWRTDAPTLKAWANTTEYEDRVRPYKTVRVLYIDDFWKARKGDDGEIHITDADVNLAFDILNDRYNDTRLITILSSEMTVEEMLNIDQALGSRIYERRQVYIKTRGKKNWRLRPQEAQEADTDADN